MFASTEPSGFPPAILSRLQRFDVRRLTVPEIEGKLARILAADGRQADPAAVHLIARLAAGGHARRRVDARPAPVHGARPDRRGAPCATCSGWPTRRSSTAFIDHLVRGDGAAGVALLDELDERGRDIRALLDQAVEAIRIELVAGIADPSAARHDPAALAAAGRRLAAIDPNRAAIGGLRFQLELAMFGAGAAPVTRRAARRQAGREPTTSHRSQPAARPAASAATTSSAAREDHRRPAAPRPSAPPATAARPAPIPAAATAEAPADAGPRPNRPAEPTPASSPPPRQLPAPTGAAASGGDLESVLAAWPAIVERLSAHPPTKPLILTCRPVAVDGAIVTLGFPEEQAFLKDAGRTAPAGASRPGSPRSSVIRSPCAAWSPTSSLRRRRLGRPRRGGAPDLRR